MTLVVEATDFVANDTTFKRWYSLEPESGLFLEVTRQVVVMDSGKTTRHNTVRITRRGDSREVELLEMKSDSSDGFRIFEVQAVISQRIGDTALANKLVHLIGSEHLVVFV